MKKLRCFILIVIIIAGVSCRKKISEPEFSENTAQEQIDFPKIDRRPEPANWNRGSMTTIPGYDPESTDPWQMDLRCYNLSTLDLSNSLDDLMFATFDDRTVWPPSNRMPADFNWQQIMELGVDPGLGVGTLHNRGITGLRIGIAILDQPLLIDHREYSANIRLYEELNVAENTDAQMHGPAVASIAVGQSVGVAPAADLYYIAVWPGTWGNDGFQRDYSYQAQAVRRVLAINELLPEDRKIRVISMSVGWMPSHEGYDDIMAAVQEATDAGIFAISVSLDQTHGFNFLGMGRQSIADPGNFQSCEPGLFWASRFYSGDRPSNCMYVPMDSRTTASPTGNEEYVFYRSGGMSWAVPYLAGMYALATQAQPDITPDQFWALALQTGRTITLNHQGASIQFGPIIDPVALIDAL